MKGESFSLPTMVKEEGTEGTDEMDNEGVVGARTRRVAEGVTTLEVSLMMLEKITGDDDLGSSVGDEDN